VGKPGPHPEAVARTSDDARASRSELDWAVINDPESARLRTAQALAAESEEAAETVRRGFALSYDAFNRRDWELNTLLLAPDDYVFLAGDLREALPDARDRYLGVAGYLEAMLLFLESWSELEVKLMDLLDLGRDRAVSLMRFNGRGRRSGLAFDQLAVGEHTFREGLCVTQTYWWDSHRAARALGLQLPIQPRWN
jgi:ketosteroid isomerase-like protein